MLEGIVTWSGSRVKGEQTPLQKMGKTAKTA
jgi:hypothetical protein